MLFFFSDRALEICASMSASEDAPVQCWSGLNCVQLVQRLKHARAPQELVRCLAKLNFDGDAFSRLIANFSPTATAAGDADSDAAAAETIESQQNTSSSLATHEKSYLSFESAAATTSSSSTSTTTEIADVEEESELKTADCAICLTEQPETAFLGFPTCTLHRCCRTCMAQYIQSTMEHGFADLRCFSSGCLASRANSDTLLRFVTRNGFDASLKSMLVRLKADARCREQLRADEAAATEPAAATHDGETPTAERARPRARDDDTAGLEALRVEQGWKGCPGCRQLIARADGCNHMTHHPCERRDGGTATHFCYLCGFELDAEGAHDLEGLAHYPTGSFNPCRMQQLRGVDFFRARLGLQRRDRGDDFGMLLRRPKRSDLVRVVGGVLVQLFRSVTRARGRARARGGRQEHHVRVHLNEVVVRPYQAFAARPPVVVAM